MIWLTREALDGKHAEVSLIMPWFAVLKTGEQVKLTSRIRLDTCSTPLPSAVDCQTWKLPVVGAGLMLKQNRTYNHMTEYELVGMAERPEPTKALFGLGSGEVAKHLPVTMQEFNTLEHAAVHVTEYGYCVHDYTTSPCEVPRLRQLY